MRKRLCWEDSVVETLRPACAIQNGRRSTCVVLRAELLLVVLVLVDGSDEERDSHAEMSCFVSPIVVGTMTSVDKAFFSLVIDKRNRGFYVF